MKDFSAKKSQHENQQNKLLTPKALALSLSPPRAPPFGTAQRAVLSGKISNADRYPWSKHYRTREGQNDEEEAHSMVPHETLRQRLRQQISKHRLELPKRHPHLPEKSADAFTRWLGGVWWSVPSQNAFRDAGYFRFTADALVIATVPMLAIAHPKASLQYLRLSKQCQRIHYGRHPRQYCDLFLPHSSPPRRWIFFVHGGAWGSGMPWMYRLVANPFLQQGWGVIIVGYRTYPDGTVEDQIEDLERAGQALRQQYNKVLGSCPITLMGHSSGAHIALLLKIKRIQEKLFSSRPGQSEDKNAISDLSPLLKRMEFDSFVGLSGPYDISHHFDYEAGRGVEEISPMKPANGYTRQAFRDNSPALRLQSTLRSLPQEDGVLDQLLPRLALFHGIEDDTVPFTATAEAARVLRACGLTRVQEFYVVETGHQDMIMQVMLGGKAQDATVEWIRNLTTCSPINLSNFPSILLARNKL
jgi:predicted esterase